jgi:hypothetical protein
MDLILDITSASPERTEEKHKNLLQYTVSIPRSELEISRIRIRSTMYIMTFDLTCKLNLQITINI